MNLGAGPELTVAAVTTCMEDGLKRQLEVYDEQFNNGAQTHQHSCPALYNSAVQRSIWPHGVVQMSRSSMVL